MALPWKEILALMPWQKVLDNAPQIVNSARQLLRRKSAEMPADAAFAPFSEAQGLEALAASQAELRNQFQEIGQLLAALSEQNALLIAQIDHQRRHARRQDWAITLIALLALFALALAGR